MKPTEFDHALRARLLRFRQCLNRSAQCMNMSSDALERSVMASKKAQLRLAASSQRLTNCMAAHGVRT